MLKDHDIIVREKFVSMIDIHNITLYDLNNTDYRIIMVKKKDATRYVNVDNSPCKPSFDLFKYYNLNLTEEERTILSLHLGCFL